MVADAVPPGRWPSRVAEILEAFTLVSTWTTDMRYLPGRQKMNEAEAFLAAAETIIRWADGRL